MSNEIGWKDSHEIEKAKAGRDDYIIRKGQYFMKTWDSYKEYVKNTGEQGRNDIAHIEEIATIISAVIKRRNVHLLGLTLTVSHNK